MRIHKLYILGLIFLLLSCSRDDKVALIYLDTNGITIKCDPSANVGDTYEVNGITYTIVNEDMLREMVAQGADVTTVCTSRVTEMGSLFESRQFNENISSWDVSKVTNMYDMFFNSTFNQDISAWDVSRVEQMSFMFMYSSFNKDISNWDVSSVNEMALMFYSSSFNQDISSWDVSNVTSMDYMFAETTFNQNLSEWNVENVTQCELFSDNTPNWTLPKPDFTNCDPN